MRTVWKVHCVHCTFVPLAIEVTSVECHQMVHEFVIVNCYWKFVCHIHTVKKTLLDTAIINLDSGMHLPSLRGSYKISMHFLWKKCKAKWKANKGLSSNTKITCTSWPVLKCGSRFSPKNYLVITSHLVVQNVQTQFLCTVATM